MLVSHRDPCVCVSATLWWCTAPDEGGNTSAGLGGSFVQLDRLRAAVRDGFRPREMQTCRHRMEPGFTELGGC
jgi:hypothetical protein